MVSIRLTFPKDETRLAGFPYGEKVYNDQVKDSIDFKEEINIIFPDNIEKIASSFVQGFFSVLVKELGYKGVEKNVTISAKTDTLIASVWKNLY